RAGLPHRRPHTPPEAAPACTTNPLPNPVAEGAEKQATSAVIIIINTRHDPFTRLSEDQLKAELTNPRPAFAQPWIARCYVRRLADRAEGRAGEIHVRQAQVGVIEHVEKLRSKLEREVFCEPGRLAHGKWHDVEAWPEYRVPRGGAKGAGGRAREGGLIEPQRGSPRRSRVRAAHQIRAIVELAGPAHVHAQERCNGQSTRSGIDSA